MIDKRKEIDVCSFCGRSKYNVEKLIAGGDGSVICNYCVLLCKTILDKKSSNTFNKAHVNNLIKNLKPHGVNEFLNNYAVGQDLAKKVLSVGVYNHYKNISNIDDGVVLDKSNILLIGPTGSGKTLFAKTLAKLLNLPFVIVDATTLTQSGYVGDDVESILSRLFQASDYNIEATQCGIICMDEVDKISSCKSDNTSTTRDVSGEGVQQSLLKIMEGTISFVPSQGLRKHPQQECIQIDTTNILFIFCGAFIGIDNIIKQRIKGSSIGFGSNLNVDTLSSSNVIKNVNQEDLISYGMIPEFVGRFPVIATLDELSREDLIKVLKEPRNSILKQYKKSFSIDNVDISFSEEALCEIVDIAIKRKIGARGLKSVMESVLLDVMYNIPSSDKKEVFVDRDMVLKIV